MFAHRFNPHYEKVQDAKWLARRDGKIVGRICAQVYDKDVQPFGASKFQYGAFDCIDDSEAANALLATAQAWLRARGAQIIHGPYTPSVNNESGQLVYGFEAAPMVAMPWHPPYLQTLIEGAGYAKAQDLLSYRYEISDRDRIDAAPLQARAGTRENIRFRSLRMKDVTGEVRIMLDIFNDAWSQNWGFVPLSFKEMNGFADVFKLVMTEQWGFVVEHREEPVAFGLVIPNLQEILGPMGGKALSLSSAGAMKRLFKKEFTSARLMLFGLRKKYQKSAIGGLIVMMLIEELKLRSRHAKIDFCEFGWVLESNLGMRKPIEASGAKIDKIHRIFEKKFASPE